MSVLISDAFAAAGAVPAQQGGSLGSILMIAGLMIIFYLLIWWPQNKRLKEHRKLISHLAKDDEILTSSGIVGRITKIADDFLTVQIAPSVEIILQKTSISAQLPKGTFKPGALSKSE